MGIEEFPEQCRETCPVALSGMVPSEFGLAPTKNCKGPEACTESDVVKRIHLYRDVRPDVEQRPGEPGTQLACRNAGLNISLEALIEE